MATTPADTMDSEESAVLVVGATGNQGGTVVNHLLGADEEFNVRGLTRRPDTEPARALAKRGVDVKRGDLNEKQTLRSAVNGADAVVIVTNIWTAGFDTAVRQAKNIADVAADAGVNHLIYSGSGYHDRDLGIDALEPAGEIEKYLRSLAVPATFVRPVWFMHNIEPAFEDIMDGTLPLPFEQGVSLQMVDVDDVGRAVARILEHPDDFVGEGFDLAGDEHTVSEMAQVLSDVTGADVQPYTIPIADAREAMGDSMAELYQWFNNGGYSVDIDRVEQRFGFEFTSFRSYLEKNGWTEKTQPSRVPGLVKSLMQD